MVPMFALIHLYAVVAFSFEVRLVDAPRLSVLLHSFIEECLAAKVSNMDIDCGVGAKRMEGW